MASLSQKQRMLKSKRGRGAASSATISTGHMAARRRLFAPASANVYVRRRSAVAKRSGLTRRVGYYGRYGPAKNQLVGRNTPEVKFFDYQVGTDASPLAVPLVVANGTCLNLIAQGAGEQQRIGRKLFVKSIQVHVLCRIPASATTVYDDYVHVWIVQDTQANGAVAAWTDVMTQEVAGAGANNLVPAASGSDVPGMEMRNMSNSERFKILWHSRLDINHAFGAGTGIEHTSGFMKCAIPLEFNGSTGVVTEVKSNNLLFFFGAMNNNNVITLQATTRLRYGDT